MSKKKILIAEDSTVFQNLAKRILTFHNFEIKSAKNGKRVISILEEEAGFDLLLLDINMPVMDGLECIEIIRSHEDDKISSLPVIAITGNAHNLSKEEYEELGINDFVLKPVDFDQIVGAIKKLTNS